MNRKKHKTRSRKYAAGILGAILLVVGNATSAVAGDSDQAITGYAAPVQTSSGSIMLGSMADKANYLHADGKVVSFNRDSHPGHDVESKFTKEAGKFSPLAAGTNGYTGTLAAQYADFWWNGRNPSYPSFGGTDCQNFVSQSLHAGGLQMSAEPIDDYHHWYAFEDGNFSASWVNVDGLASYLQYDIPGATWRYTWDQSHEDTTFTPDDIVTGDLVYYRWEGATGGGRHHAAMQVGIGTDPVSGWYGNLIDQHTTDRYHAFWSLHPYNSQASTTTYELWHVWP